MFDFNLIFIPLFGFLAGLLVSIFGGGGGGLYVPGLILFFGVPTQFAAAKSLESVLPTTAAGAISHFREGNVNIRTGLILGIGGLIGTLIGVYFANMIPSNLLAKILGAFTLVMLIPMFRSLLKRRRQQKEEQNGNTKKTVKLTGFRRITASFFGVVSGIMAGIFGISGSGPIVAGLYSLDLPAVMVVGTSVFVLIFNSIAGIGGYFLLGRLDLTLTVLLAVGSVVGAFVGPKLLKRINPKTMEKIYGPVMVGIRLFWACH